MASNVDVGVCPPKQMQDFLRAEGMQAKEGEEPESRILSVEEVERVYERAKEKGLHLHQLVRGGEVHLPPLCPPPLPHNPRLQERLQRLRGEQQDRDYHRMTRDVDSSRAKPHQGDSIGYQIRQLNRQLIAVLQFVVSVAAAFLFGFMVPLLWWGQSLDVGVRLLLGVICALTVGLAELYFLAVRLASEDYMHDQQALPKRHASCKPHLD